MEVGVPTLLGRPALKSVGEEHRKGSGPVLILLQKMGARTVLDHLPRLSPVTPIPAQVLSLKTMLL